MRRLAMMANVRLSVPVGRATSRLFAHALELALAELSPRLPRLRHVVARAGLLGPIGFAVAGFGELSSFRSCAVRGGAAVVVTKATRPRVHRIGPRPVDIEQVVGSSACILEQRDITTSVATERPDAVEELLVKTGSRRVQLLDLGLGHLELGNADKRLFVRHRPLKHEARKESRPLVPLAKLEPASVLQVDELVLDAHGPSVAGAA